MSGGLIYDFTWSDGSLDNGQITQLDLKLQTIAPALDINLPYHVCFVYHNNDRDWVLNVIEKLESPNLGFKCCCHERDFDMGLSFIQKIFQGIKNSQRTVIVLSPDFVTNMWNQCESQVLSEMDITLLHKDLVIIMLQECEVPTTLSELPCIDAGVDDWWSKLLVVLCSSDDTPMTEETIVPMSPSLVGLNPNLQSGHLLMSCKSKCGCCGKEYVDPTEVPDDLMAHGIQIPHEEYTKAMKHLLSDSRFRCHMWCYNVPLAMVFFTFLLAICLAVIPLVETKLIFRGSETGLEFVHGTVVWLCALTVYLLVTHISKRKFKDNTYRRLSHVNTIFIKYNLLAGVENLGLGDCNKFYLHFFYFEVGPCLAYLQELMANMEECSAYFVNEVVETECSVDLNCEDQSNGNTINSDHMRVLGSTPMTNTNIQNQAEDLLLDNSGEYINLLITKKLEMPRRQRHAQEAPCLCQFVEQKVYKMIV